MNQARQIKEAGKRIVIEATASKHGGWLVAVRWAGGGVAVWQRRAKTLAELRARLEEAAMERYKAIASIVVAQDGRSRPIRYARMRDFACGRAAS